MRFALIRASGTGAWATALLKFHLQAEVECDARPWYARVRVPTEANLSDFPSRLAEGGNEKI